MRGQAVGTGLHRSNPENQLTCGRRSGLEGGRGVPIVDGQHGRLGRGALLLGARWRLNHGSICRPRSGGSSAGQLELVCGSRSASRLIVLLLLVRSVVGSKLTLYDS